MAASRGGSPDLAAFTATDLTPLAVAVEDVPAEAAGRPAAREIVHASAVRPAKSAVLRWMVIVSPDNEAMVFPIERVGDRNVTRQCGTFRTHARSVIGRSRLLVQSSSRYL